MRKQLFFLTLMSSFMLNVIHLFAAIPTTERAALIAVYNSTNGDSWGTNNWWKHDGDLEADGFSYAGTEGLWYGVTVSTDHVTQLVLNNNNLAGTIPSDLENLTELQSLQFYNNPSLSGSIPPELGTLSKLEGIDFGYSQLTGSIPAALGGLSSLGELWLNNNQLSGSIPAALGGLSNLYALSINGNKITGRIPDELLNVNFDADYSDFRWNGIYTDNSSLRTLLNSTQMWGGDWESTQTIAPENVAAGSATQTSVVVSWDPILYTGDTGGYQVYYSTTSGGPYTYFDITDNKSASSLTVTGLTPSTMYYFVVYSKTNAHANNSNIVISEVSSEVFTETLDASLPVELVSFTAKAENGAVVLEWTTASETDNLGFIIERRLNSMEWQQIASYQTHVELAGKGTTSNPSQYSFTDDVTTESEYTYRLSEVSVIGQTTELATTTVETSAAPTTIQLYTAYPNPFNPSTNLKYQLAQDSHVTLAVYDVLGRQVRLLANQHQAAGEYSISWNGKTDAGLAAPSGTYLVRLQAGVVTQIQKVLFVK